MEIESAETPLDVGIEENRPEAETGAEDPEVPKDPAESTIYSETLTPLKSVGAEPDVAPGGGAPAASAVGDGTKLVPGKCSCQKTLPSTALTAIQSLLLALWGPVPKQLAAL